MNRFNTTVLLMSIFLSLNYCSQSKYYYSPRPASSAHVQKKLSEEYPTQACEAVPNERSAVSEIADFGKGRLWVEEPLNSD